MNKKIAIILGSETDIPTMEAANKASLKGNFLMAISIMWGVASAVAFIEGAIGIAMSICPGPCRPDTLGPCHGAPPVTPTGFFEGKEHEEWIDKNLIQKSLSLTKIAKVK